QSRAFDRRATCRLATSAAPRALGRVSAASETRFMLLLACSRSRPRHRSDAAGRVLLRRSGRDRKPQIEQAISIAVARAQITDESAERAAFVGGLLLTILAREDREARRVESGR